MNNHGQYAINLCSISAQSCPSYAQSRIEHLQQRIDQRLSRNWSSIGWVFWTTPKIERRLIEHGQQPRRSSCSQSMVLWMNILYDDQSAINHRRILFIFLFLWFGPLVIENESPLIYVRIVPLAVECPAWCLPPVTVADLTLHTTLLRSWRNCSEPLTKVSGLSRSLRIFIAAAPAHASSLSRHARPLTISFGLIRTQRRQSSCIVPRAPGKTITARWCPSLTTQVVL